MLLSDSWRTRGGLRTYCNTDDTAREVTVELRLQDFEHEAHRERLRFIFFRRTLPPSLPLLLLESVSIDPGDGEASSSIHCRCTGTCDKELGEAGTTTLACKYGEIKASTHFPITRCLTPLPPLTHSTVALRRIKIVQRALPDVPIAAMALRAIAHAIAVRTRH